MEMKINEEWIAAPPILNTFVCNVGDMLDSTTGGLYLSVQHRVRNISSKNRLVFRLLFRPNFNAEVRPIEIADPLRDNQAERWEQASVHTFQGTYGGYLAQFRAGRRDLWSYWDAGFADSNWRI
ncbi:MAG: 2OG-Fe(II) oxygenase family protein [Armatimonas sp.]